MAEPRMRSSNCASLQPNNCGSAAASRPWRTLKSGCAAALIHRQRQVRQDLAEKEPRAALACDEVGVLADPAEPRVAGQRLLEHRRGVDAHPVAERSDALLQLSGERGERAAQGLVVVAPESVTRHVGEPPVLEHRACVTRLSRPVIHARAHDAHRTGVQLLRAAAHEAVALHVVHLAVEAVAEPLEQMPLVLGNVDAGHAERIEAERAGTLAELASQRVQIKGGRARHGATTGVSIMTWWRCRTLCIPPRRCVPSMPTRSMSSGSPATRS